MCSQYVRVFECVIDVNRPQSASAIVAPSYIVSRLKASWHVRNPHKKLQKSLEHQTTVFFSFHASFTFILGFYGGVFGDFFGVFGYKHWQVWQARRLSTCCTLTNETGDCARWWHTLTLTLTHTWAQQKLTANKTRWIDFQVKVMLGSYNAPLPSVAPSYLPKNSAQIARCVCKLNVPKFVTHLQKKKRKKVSGRVSKKFVQLAKEMNKA